jgi:quinate dehydrogenase
MGSIAQHEENDSQVVPPVDQYERHGFLFGYPIAHSLSPCLHNKVFEQLNVNWGFELLESKDMNLFLTRLRDERLYGTLTFPSKTQIPPQIEAQPLTKPSRLRSDHAPQSGHHAPSRRADG